MTSTLLPKPEVAAAPIARAKSGRRFSIGKAIAWVYLSLFLLITLFPFYWILRTALSNNYALISNPTSLLPVGFTLGPFLRVLGLASPSEAIAEGGSGASIDLALFVRNSLIYATLLTVIVVFCSLLAAYAFSRLQWRGRNIVFSIFLAALMIPGIMTLLPNFVLIHDLGWTNTFAGLIAPSALFSAFAIFFLRQFMLGLSSEIEEAALIDGLGPFKILFRITVPMTTGPIMTLSLLTFINAWNEYFWPLLIANDPSVRPLTVALGVFQQSSPQTQPDYAGLMAASLVAALPMLVLFMIFGKRIVNSIGFTGIK
ncbi:sugar ABC transporter permease [Leifsonia sp. Root227]|uniref:carbohydrate ABC transporter permease n=1 Tax=unclassified Leifsonia TaxID=2663824 RepID=UPI0006F47AA1|nr:carbohydrate ABC transporter permease [Leifsonia sp. Root227]KRC51728.1 sugar ABC transporter permease [Leifsonia sp. Root227]